MASPGTHQVLHIPLFIFASLPTHIPRRKAQVQPAADADVSQVRRKRDVPCGEDLDGLADSKQGQVGEGDATGGSMFEDFLCNMLQ